MADKSTKVTYDTKSGVDFKSVPKTLLGGNPPKKSVEEIEKAYTTTSAPVSVRS